MEHEIDAGRVHHHWDNRLEPTLLLTAWATLVAVLMGVPAGIVSARHHNRVLDQSLMGLALLGLSIPNFLLGLLMILVFGVWLRWLPVAGYVPLDAGLWPNLRSLLMPNKFEPFCVMLRLKLPCWLLFRSRFAKAKTTS